ncbi:MAG: helix-turn-helix domain-containing protein [Candidatus Obscuribacterales bacterium]|nr:helix-turn-helix domain-containing protein [Candidatus Obscuribacterales bacterium]
MKKTLNDYLRKLPPARRKKIEKRAAELISEEMTLRELRKARQQSQNEIARVLHVKQAEVSKMERRTDVYVSTLRNYVEAMGGRLEITVTFPDRLPVRINQFEDLESQDLRK